MLKQLLAGFILFCIYGSIKSDVEPKIWALLVAGSQGWFNYRHQADVCHSYHLLRNHGIPAENIITMMYDDIANNKLNRYPGKIFNSPVGKDVYEGVQIDYRGNDVTPENFLAVLSGNHKNVRGGNGRVINSTENDRIFVYFSDHGSVGLIAFPNNILTAYQLSNALKNLHKNKRYDQLTIYLETCESGSMFQNILPESLKIYAMTAANAHESSWGCYCENPLKLPCLGDLFSINWMEDSDKENLKQETLKQQFNIVKSKTNASHVSHFGNEMIWNEPVGEFQGEKDNLQDTNVFISPDKYRIWPSRDIPLLELKALYDGEKNKNRKKNYLHQLRIMKKKRFYLDFIVKDIVHNLVHDENNRQRILSVYPNELHEHLNCHDTVVQTFHRVCFNLGKNSYALKYVYVLANLCEHGISEQRIIETLMYYCLDVKSNEIMIE